MAFFKKEQISYTHKCLFEFPFVKAKVRNSTIFYPYIEVDLCRLGKQEGHQGVMCLLDSGADYTILPKDLGEQLDIDFSELSPCGPPSGISGEIKDVKFFKSPITIKFLGTEIFTDVMWIDKKNAMPVIGRIGFFDKFDVYFKQSIDRITMVFHPVPACKHLQEKNKLATRAEDS